MELRSVSGGRTRAVPLSRALRKTVRSGGRGAGPACRRRDRAGGGSAMASAIRRVKVCLNGQRGRAEHPALPVTPAELAAEAAAAVAAGAEAVHLHPRSGSGAESLLDADVGAAVAAV